MYTITDMQLITCHQYDTCANFIIHESWPIDGYIFNNFNIRFSGELRDFPWKTIEEEHDYFMKFGIRGDGLTFPNPQLYFIPDNSEIGSDT